jgi:hypothetical protein
MPVCVINQLVAFHKTHINILLLEAILPHKSFITSAADIQVCEVAVSLEPCNSVQASCPNIELQRICDLNLSNHNNLLNSKPTVI